MTKKFKQRAEADVGLIFTAYNLRRLMSIIGTEVLIGYLEVLFSLISFYLHQFRLKTSQYQQSKVFIYFSVFLDANKIKAVRMAYEN